MAEAEGHYIKKNYSTASLEEKLSFIQYCFISIFTLKEDEIYQLIIQDSNETDKQECLELYYELGGVCGDEASIEYD